jgi:hypothetical protein
MYQTRPKVRRSTRDPENEPRVEAGIPSFRNEVKADLKRISITRQRKRFHNRSSEVRGTGTVFPAKRGVNGLSDLADRHLVAGKMSQSPNDERLQRFLATAPPDVVAKLRIQYNTGYQSQVPFHAKSS